jgi:transcription initiation factor TFIID subunit 1
MARADDDDDYDDDVDDDDRGRGATYADAGARDDDDDDDYDGASEDAMDASDDGDAYEDESESESEDDDYDEDVGKTKKRGKTGRTTRASGGAVVVVPTTTGRGERGVKVASVNADDALRAQLSGKQDPMAFVISSSVPETGEVLKFTSLLHNARDGRTYAAAFGDARRGAGEDDASKATNRRLDMEQREDDGGGSENDEDYDEDAEDGDEDDAAWFAKVDENFPLERYATLNPTLSDDEDDDEYYADNEAARPALDVGEAEARMKPRRGESGLENEEWERGVVWGADSDEDEEIRLAAVGIDTVGAFKKPRRDEETDLSSQVTVPSLPPATALASARARRGEPERRRELVR